jgi:hypothetical protein
MRPSRRALLAGSLALNLILLAAWVAPLRLTGAQADVRYFPETRHTVRGVFLSYWTAHGGLAQQGFPLTEEFQEQNKLNGKTYTVQYFERSIFELHPENQPPFNVLLSQLGKFELDARYPNGSNPAAAPVSGPGGGPTPTQAPAPARPTATVPTPPTGQQFTGHGQQVSPHFHLNKGLAVFQMTHNGASNFAIKLLDSQGHYVELLVNEIGAFQGGKAVGIETAGDYLLDISANGDWTVNVQQPNPAAATLQAPQTFQGHGQQASPLVRLATGLATFRMTHNGESNFAITLLDGQGRYVELLANEIGAFDGSKAVRIDTSGPYILDIAADGDWTVSVQQ